MVGWLTIAALLYAFVALGYASAIDDDPDTSKTALEVWAEIGAALAWPLFHVQWRSHGRHAAGSAHAQVQMVSPFTGVSGAIA